MYNVKGQTEFPLIASSFLCLFSEIFQIQFAAMTVRFKMHCKMWILKNLTSVHISKNCGGKSLQLTWQ